MPPAACKPRPVTARAGPWWIATSLGMLGIVAAFGLDHGLGDLAFAVGALALTAMALRATGATEDGARLPVGVLGIGAVVALALLQASGRRFDIQVVGPMAATGGQLLLLALSQTERGRTVGWGRTAVPVAGHLLVAASTGTLAVAGLSGMVVLLYTGGFALLLLEAFWIHRGLRGTRVGFVAWEGAFLLAVSTSIVLVTWLTFTWGPAYSPGVRDSPAATPILYMAVLFGVALLAGPPRLPEHLRLERGSPAELVVDAISFTAILTVMTLVVYAAAQAAILPLFIALTTWLVAAVTFEYLALGHALTTDALSPAGDPPEPDELPEITVVVAARNDARVLAKSMEENLALDLPLTFLLVPAADSSDGTLPLCHALAREHGDLVRVIEGETGSKAEDLNQIWGEIDTDLALILDADETVERSSVLWGLERLAGDATIGVVQGRKKSRSEGQGPLARFIAADRRYATLLDHHLQSDRFDAAHFAGSGALLRTRIPPAIGGWRATTLTEDIEFSIRLHLAGTARIVYEPRMVVREADPEDMGSLVRQRGRWARGWGQVYSLHFRAVLQASPELGARRTFGLAWQLLTSVSAPWVTMLPVVTLLWVIMGSPFLPGWLAIALGVYILPARLLTYGIPFFRDPVDRPEPRLRRVGEVVLHAYLWIPMGWVLQLYALYQALSDAPRIWQATRPIEQAEPGRSTARPGA